MFLCNRILRTSYNVLGSDDTRERVGRRDHRRPEPRDTAGVALALGPLLVRSGERRGTGGEQHCPPARHVYVRRLFFVTNR